MHAIIRFRQRIKKELDYNEAKVTQGEAALLFACNFAKDIQDCSLEEKIFHFERLTSLNNNVRDKLFQITMNYSKWEDISNDKMGVIAKEYMDKISMGHLPYLVYRHFDSGHPHVHIVTSTIEYDGHRFEYPENKHINATSDRVTKELEQTYDLITKEENARLSRERDPKYAQKIKYGEDSTTSAISRVLVNVLPQYKYTSFDEANALLRLYNVTASKAHFDKELERYRGVLYHVLDEKGNRIGRPVHASYFDLRPTIKYLEARYAANLVELQEQGERWRLRVTTAIDWSLLDTPPGLAGLQQYLANERISAVYYHDKQGALQDVFYVDHATTAIFHGATLGSKYTAEALRERCGEQAPGQRQGPPNATEQLRQNQLPDQPNTSAEIAKEEQETLKYQPKHHL